MINSECAAKRLSDALKSNPQLIIDSPLGAGNKGEAYLLDDGRVLKLTIDQEEYRTAEILKRQNLKNIVTIYETWSYKCCYSESDGSEILFAIIEEYVDTNIKKNVIKEFVRIFKIAWFNKYFCNTNATFDDLDERMRNPEKYKDAITFTKQHILLEGIENNMHKDFEYIYDQLISAYNELYQKSPNSNLDLNDGNLGFTSDGVLKIFDIQ